MRPGADVLEGRLFSREWVQWFRNTWDAITAVQRVAPLVVVREVTAAYTAEPGEMVICDPTSGAFAVTLPAVTDGFERMEINVKHDSDSGNDITLTPNGSETIDGAATQTIGARECLTVIAIPSEARWVIR